MQGTCAELKGEKDSVDKHYFVKDYKDKQICTNCLDDNNDKDCFTKIYALVLDVLTWEVSLRMVYFYLIQHR